MPLVSLLQDLRKRGLAPASTDDFLEALRTMNEAVHGFVVHPEAASLAVEVGTRFLEELSQGARRKPRPQ